MRTRTFAWASLAVLLVAGNTALVLWLDRPGPVGSGGRSRVSDGAREPALPLRPPAAGERELLAAVAAPVPPAVSLRVEVRGPRGEPVAGAAVRVLADGEAVLAPFADEVLAQGITGADGAVDLPLERALAVRVEASAPDLGRGEARGRPPRVLVPLPEEAVLRVRVVEEGTGRPVYRATVEVRADRGAEVALTGGVDARWPRVAVAATGEEGLAGIGGLAPGPHRISVRAPGRVPAVATADPGAGGTAAVEVALAPSVSIRGRVTYPGFDRGPREGRVVAAPPGRHPFPDRAPPEEIRAAELEEDGTFHLEDVPPEWTRRLLVEADGVLHRSPSLRHPGFDPDTGQALGEIEIPLPGNNQGNLLAFRGVVRDPSGAPLEGVRVFVGRRLPSEVEMRDRGGPLPPWGAPEARTGPDGAFRLAVPGAATQELLFLHPGFAPLRMVLPFRSRDRVFDATLRRGSRILVAVRDAGGGPAGGASIALRMRGFPDGRGVPDEGDVHASLGPLPLTDGEGRCVVGPVGPGEWAVLARSADGSAAARVVVEVGEADGAVDLALRPAPVLRGRVRRADGSPAAGALLGVPGEGPGPTFRWTRADPDGRFSLEGWIVHPSRVAEGSIPLLLGGDLLFPGGEGHRMVPLGADLDLVVAER